MTGRPIVALAAATALTIVPALIEGHYVNRWGTPPDLSGAANQVESFPDHFGDWTLTQNGEQLHPEVCRELAIAGYMTRTYTRRKDAASVSVLLMVGQSGPLIRHPPNICYANMANEQIGEMTQFQVATTSPPSEFNLLQYKRAGSVINDQFLVAYALATDATWKVPTRPRIEFGAAPMLYKVQLLTSLDPSQPRETGAQLLKQFASEFCAAFQKHLQADTALPSEKPAS